MNIPETSPPQKDTDETCARCGVKVKPPCVVCDECLRRRLNEERQDQESHDHFFLY